MIKKIFDILQSVDIEAFYQECSIPTDNYAIFDIFNEKDTEVADNVSNATIYSISINYWYRKNSRLLSEKYKDIKKVMKNNGFHFESCTDIKGETHFGKSLDFKMKIWEE